MSASTTVAYFRDGDTVIMSLSPSGTTAFVRSIPAGSSASLGFSVNPDDTRIAVAVINESAGQRTAHGYVEDLRDGGGHVDLWSNTGDAAVRWPVGWTGGDLVDQLGPYCLTARNTGACDVTVSYHVIDSATGSRMATVCESAPTYYSPYGAQSATGLPTAAGVTCTDFAQNSSGAVTSESIGSVDWRGGDHLFITRTASTPGHVSLPVTGCYLSPDGVRAACIDIARDPVTTLLTPNGMTHDLRRNYNLLGWIDPTHLLVEIDNSTLAMLSPDSGALATIRFPQADNVAMVSTLPGSL